MMNRHKLIVVAFLGSVLISTGAWLNVTTVWSRAGRLEALRSERQNLESHLQQAAFEQREGPVDSDAVQLNNEVSSLLQELAGDLAQTNVKDRSMTTDTPISIGGIQSVSLHLTFRSSLPDVFELLKRFNDYQRAVCVQHLGIMREPQAAIDALLVSIRLQALATPLEEP